VIHREPIGISVDRVEKTFDRRGTVTALAGVSVDIAPGEFFSILGPSGCGKSTLLRCIAGLDAPTRGEVKVGGRPVDAPPESMGIVFQRDALLEWRTVLDNLMLPIDFRRKRRTDARPRAMELLDQFGLKGFEQRYPAELSGGMRQRTAICRALIDEPALLLMDEPFGALDALTRDQLNVDLQEMWSADRKTVVFVTHSIAEAVFLSDRVAVFTPRPGRIAEIINVDLPRPRRLSVRGDTRFTDRVARIREMFEGMGLLKERS
jgi:NitT/TauT family transport system ATP-binding protein